MKIGLRWLVEVSWVSLVPPLDSGPAGEAPSYISLAGLGRRRNDECGGVGIQALSRLRSIIFVPMTRWVAGMTISGARMTAFLAGRPGGIYGGAGAGYSGR